MLITVKLMNGPEHSVETSPEQTILSLKETLAAKINLSPSQQRLMYKGKPLLDQQCLQDYAITSGTKLFLILKRGETGEAALESKFIRQLRSFADQYVVDVDTFTAVFRKEMHALADEMSIDDIERYAESRIKSIKLNELDELISENAVNDPDRSIIQDTK